MTVDSDGREHSCPGARTISLQTDHHVGLRRLHGACDFLLVLDEQGRVLASAPKRPFDPEDIHAFCLAHGLPLRRTDRTYKQPSMPPKAPGYHSLSFTRRTDVLMVGVLFLSVAVGLAGPFHLLVVLGIGLVIVLVLMLLLTQ